MRFSERCPKCMSPRVAKQVPQAVASGSVVVLSDGASSGEGAYLLTAWVCQDCGYTELYRSRERTVTTAVPAAP